ncbi:DUF1482 family protein [Escherichia coli]|nr:DUF1482 family protein [Escherichia coli]
MTAQLFVLAVYMCGITGPCDYEPYKVFDSKKECEETIYNERIMRGECFPVDGIIRHEDLNS